MCRGKLLATGVMPEVADPDGEVSKDIASHRAFFGDSCVPGFAGYASLGIHSLMSVTPMGRNGLLYGDCLLAKTPGKGARDRDGNTLASNTKLCELCQTPTGVSYPSLELDMDSTFLCAASSSSMPSK
eukprot:scaffold6996_cov19-Tisochrysis_lutea.AAC.3